MITVSSAFLPGSAFEQSVTTNNNIRCLAFKSCSPASTKVVLPVSSTVSSAFLPGSASEKSLCHSLRHSLREHHSLQGIGAIAMLPFTDLEDLHRHTLMTTSKRGENSLSLATVLAWQQCLSLATNQTVQDSQPLEIHCLLLLQAAARQRITPLSHDKGNTRKQAKKAEH